MTLADGLGFEPKTALRLYSISSAAPSTGLGHLSVSESLPRTPGPTDHSRSIRACDDARVSHVHEQTVFDNPCRHFDRRRHGRRIGDAAFEHQIQDQVAVVGYVGGLLPTSHR